MKDYKFVSKNTVDQLSLHDCECSRLYYSAHSLVFEMEWMEVLASHPDNPHSKAHQSGEGMIVLYDPIIISAQLTGGSEPDKTLSLESIDVSSIELLDFDEQLTDGGYMLNLFGQLGSGAGYDFIVMRLTYRSSEVMFDELEQPSWFENNSFKGAE